MARPKSKVLSLKREIKQLNSDMSDISQRLTKLVPNVSEEELMEILNDLPITNLRDSLDYSLGKFVPKFSLKNMNEFSKLMKEQAIIQQKIISKQNELSIEKADVLLKKINLILK